MPRRNNRPKRRQPTTTGLEQPTTEEELTFEQMAHQLVRRGLASPMVVETGRQFYTEQWEQR